MNETSHRRRTGRVRTRSTRRLKLVMLAVGSVGLLIGIGFLITSKLRALPGLQHWGAVYVLASLGVLAASKAMMASSQGHRSRRSTRSERSRRGVSRADSGRISTEAGS